MHTLIVVVCALSALWWAWSMYALVRTMRGIPRLMEDRSPELTSWPRVSLIVAARDEERELERAVRSRLAEDYPNLQVVVVDDRSTDATPAIADALAKADPRVRVVHITELPAGWLGKLNAMHRGVQEADGEWLLFSDADVEFAPGTLRRSIALCEHQQRDHMAVLPEFRQHGWAIDSAINVFSQILVLGGRLWTVSDMKARAAVGGGMFNLVRRAAFDRTPGFEWLRMEIADDVALGQMIKRHGGRPVVVNAADAVSLDFYRNIGEMAAGIEKTGFALIGRFRVSVMFLSCALMIVTEMGFFAGFAHPAPWVRAMALATWALACATQMTLVRWAKRRVWPGLLFPFGMMFLVWMTLRSGWLVWRRGGIAWRGTLYKVSELRAGSRIELI